MKPTQENLTKLIMLRNVLIVVLVFFIGVLVSGNEKGEKQITIDLPEEYPLISRDSSKPDQLEGFFRNDTLVIQFKIKE